jgi:phosphopantetheinyl transferase
MDIRVADRWSSDGRTGFPVTSAAPRNSTVWIAQCVAGLEARALGNFLSREELARCAKFRLAADRERFIGSRLLLRAALSHAVENEVRPSEWQFVMGRFGKPELASGHPPIHFNLSHSGSLIAVAVDSCGPIGVDVERLEEEEFDDGSMPLSLLSPGERARLAACPEQQRYREFVKLWTMKEAHAKRLGLGAQLDFSSFDIAWRPGCDDETVETAGGNFETRFLDMPHGAYWASVAIDGAPSRHQVAWRHIPPGSDFANLFLEAQELT